jgi:hypothetical protein
MWLQRGEVPQKFRSIQHIAGVLLSVAGVAGLKYRDNELDLSECIGFTQHETMIVNLDSGSQKVTGTVIGLITPRSATVRLVEIAKGNLSKEVMRLQAHHYLVVPDFDLGESTKPLTTLFYKKMWGVELHQQAALHSSAWGQFITHAVQLLFRMDHPTDLSVQEEAEMLLLNVMLKCMASSGLPKAA